MPEVLVNTTNTMRAAFAYYESEAHNGHDERNVHITAINMLPNKSYADQFDQLLSLRPKINTDKRKQIQGIMIMMSFAKDELDPSDPANWKKANEVGQQFVKEQYPDCQGVVYTQIDGKSGLIHNHIIVCNCRITDHKAIKSSAYYLLNNRKKTNEIIRRNGISLSKSLSDETDYAIMYGVSADKKSKHERRLEMSGAEYIWEKDIKERVTAAMNAATSEQDFYDNQLAAHGLTISRKGKAKEATDGEYVTYVLTDKSKMPPDDPDQSKTVKAKSYKLGSEYEPAHLREILKEKQEKEQVQQRTQQTPTTTKPITAPKTPKIEEKSVRKSEKSAFEGSHKEKAEQIHVAKISDEPTRRKKTVKSAISDGVTRSKAPDQTAPASEYDEYTHEMKMTGSHKKKNGKIKFDDTAAKITAAVTEREKIENAKKSFLAEVARNEQDQRRRAVMRDIESIEFDDPMDEDDPFRRR